MFSFIYIYIVHIFQWFKIYIYIVDFLSQKYKKIKHVHVQIKIYIVYK